MLTPGQVLFVPAGWPHTTDTVNTATAADAGHSLEDIAAATRASEDRELVAYVLREGSALVMVRITPSSDWPGQGLLGCHLARTPR